MLLSGKLVIEELFKKRQAELNKHRPNGERLIQRFGTILVGDAGLRTIVRILEEEAKIKAIQDKKEASLQKHQEYRAGVDMRKEERTAKKAEEEARKQARLARKAASQR